jgi:hypothetical protein
MESANQILSQVRALIEQGRAKDALPLAERAVNTAPQYLLTHVWLGYTHEQLKQNDKAIRAYARALALEPHNERVKQSLIQLLPDKLPARMDTATLETLRESVYGKSWERKELSVNVNAAVHPALPQPERRAFYTHGVLFPPQGITSDPLTVQKGVNRVCMGYVFDPNGNEWQLRFRVFYVSEGVAQQGRNYAPLAEQVCATLLQLYWLAQQSLNTITRFSPDKPTDVWLCEGGKAGAEQPANAPAHLYFYDINSPERSSLEWLREMTHEYGHLVLPGIAGFEGGVEPYINGHIGERLFLLWLAAQSLNPSDKRSPAAFNVSPQDLAAYVRDNSYTALRRFVNEGPRSPFIEDVGVEGMEFVVGFLLYVERTHGSLLMQAVLDDTQKQVGVYLTARDVFSAYARTLDRIGAEGYRFYPTVPAPKFSRLSQPRSAEQLAQNEPLVLHKGDEAAYWVYLPSHEKRKWKLQVIAHAPPQSVLSVAFGLTGTPQSSEATPDGASAKATFNVATSLDGWQLVRVKLQSGAAPVTLHEFSWYRGEMVNSGNRPTAEATLRR